jgi:signal transduction histidine kinase
VNNYVHIKVVDSVEGIPKTRLLFLLGPSFTQKDERVKAGTGLFNSYNIIQKDFVKINFQSEVGVGTTLRLFCPQIWESE